MHLSRFLFDISFKNIKALRNPLFSKTDFKIFTKHMEIYFGVANSREMNADLEIFLFDQFLIPFLFGYCIQAPFYLSKLL